MSKQTMKTGLMYSPLSERVFWGTINTKTGVAKPGTKDITSDFIGIMLQKYQINTDHTIMSNGKTEAVIMVLDEKASKKYALVDEMYSLLESLAERPKDDDDHEAIVELLKKARGE